MDWIGIGLFNDLLSNEFNRLGSLRGVNVRSRLKVSGLVAIISVRAVGLGG